MSVDEKKRCSQCRKELSSEDVVMRKIRCNREWITLPFCKDKPCAGNYQMGCEG